MMDRLNAEQQRLRQRLVEIRAQRSLLQDQIQDNREQEQQVAGALAAMERLGQVERDADGD